MTAFGYRGSDSSSEQDHLPGIRFGLRAAIDALARHLLGEPVRGGRTARTLKFGTRSGSLHVEISGRKQGLWHDHAEGVGGDGLALIRHVNGGTFPDTVAWAANWLGINIGRPASKPDPARAAEREAKQEHERAKAVAQEALVAAGRVARARWWWSRRKPLAGTLGARYLGSRGIVEPPGGWPDCVAFLPVRTVTFEDQDPEGRAVWRTVPCGGAVIVAATDADGLIQGVQRICLDKDARNIRYEGGKNLKVKLTNGVLTDRGAVVRLPRVR